MRSNLIALVVASATIVSAVQTNCARDSIEELVARTSCGNNEAILECLGSADIDQLVEVELCFSIGGCEQTDAAFDARWLIQECQTEGAELRIRQDSTTADSEETTAETSAESTAESTAETTARASTTIASTDATTTADSTSAAETTSTAAAASTTSSTSSTTSTSNSATTAAASTTSSLVCSTTTIITTKVCSATTENGSTRTTCSSTATPVETCAAGNICSEDKSGQPICMKRDNTLTTSGLVVALVFGFGIGAFIVALIVMYCQAARQAKRDKAERMALLSNPRMGKERSDSDVEAARARNTFLQQHDEQGSEANIPLITTTGAGQSHNDFGDDVGEANYNPPSSRTGVPPVPPLPPKLHQGLGSLGQH
ncbi:hypothetical protein PVAG01_01350 [Phlyctema vagabunda]|uniref:Uncharacterized protein n=1 Tax=Phlyctema vagabunda TaxID=108571 RepID=A0ABR4PWW6_9HELO